MKYCCLPVLYSNTAFHSVAFGEEADAKQDHSLESSRRMRFSTSWSRVKVWPSQRMIHTLYVCEDRHTIHRAGLVVRLPLMGVYIYYFSPLLRSRPLPTLPSC